MKICNFAAVAAVLCASGLAGCATIIEGTTQPVSVATTPESGAQCTLKNSEGIWYVTSPGSTTVHKTKHDLTVSCKKDGYPGGEVVALSHFGGATAGNVILGGVVGLGVDAASGANFYYDNSITVDLGKPVTASAASAGAPAAAPAAAAASK
jgi:hypothetical protein